MEEAAIIEHLLAFGLTRQEALLYLTLVKNGELTGYEAAKETGISRSNVYSALAGLTEKGAACMAEGAATKYIAVDIEEFCENTVRKLNGYGEFLKSHMPKKKQETEGYITIQGYGHIKDKITNMLNSCEKRLYLAVNHEFLLEIKDLLIKTTQRGIKTVIITDEVCEISGAVFHYTALSKGQIRLITDSAYVLTGEVNGEAANTCLYSAKENLITVFKESLRNQITLIEIEERKNKT